MQGIFVSTTTTTRTYQSDTPTVGYSRDNTEQIFVRHRPQLETDFTFIGRVLHRRIPNIIWFWYLAGYLLYMREV